jgi:VWFA-related protein
MPVVRNLLLGFLISAVFAAVSVAAQNDQGIRIDVPVDGHVRIENQYGSVQTEVWDEKYVSVAATFESGVIFKRSPVVIDNRKKLLLISVSRTPVDPIAEVLLIVKLPRTAHAEIVTAKGSISLVGIPSSASIRSVSGDLNVELPRPLNIDINARSISGSIRSELDSPLQEGGKSLRTRIGTGQQLLRMNSETGQISLVMSQATTSAETAQSSPPVLSGRTNDIKGAGTPASASDSDEVSEGDVIRVDSQLVTLNMSVIDRTTSRGILGLNQNDFKLFEDGAEQRIVQFESASAPFDLMLLIDLSGSTRDKVKLIRDAALRFVEAARPSDRIGIITFAGQAQLVSPVTLDRDRLRQSINTIGTASGDTKLYDAIDFTMRHFQSDARNTRRTAIVLMSDGLDGTIPGVYGQIGSRLGYKELLSKIQEFDGVVYALWLDTYYEALNPKDTQPEAFDTAHDQMQGISEAGGGTFYEVLRLEDLAGAYERVIADLGTVYSLSYRPENKTRDGSWRAIKVQVSKPSAVARGKHGYYAN